ncbi:MAG: glycine cleavage system protein GcvH [Deltaproteobacteria bacterium]|nr:glycine cleavage system protein GcvH [Deltaproteobacteria bacterium]
MPFPPDLLYHHEHTWARLQKGAATVGITEHAQKELGDVIYVELPAVGRAISAGDVFGSVESAKSISELYSPVAGEVVEVNTALENSPELINDDPYGEGWMIKLKLAAGFTPSGLLGAQAYQQLIHSRSDEG